MTLLFQAELLKLSGRPAARLAWLALVLVGALGPLAQMSAATSSISFNGAPISEHLDLSAPAALAWSLRLRGFYLAQTALLLLASQSFAGEWSSRTLRDELVRPVRRTTVLAAKLGALSSFSFTSQFAGTALGALVGAVLVPGQEGPDWGPVLAGAAAQWVCETGFATFALAASVLTRSVAGGLAAGFLFLLGERLVAMGLTVLGWVVEAIPPGMVTISPAVERLLDIAPFFPSSGWAAFEAWVQAEPAAWQPWVALVGWSVIAVVVADRSFARAEVP
jgi:ABC-type transport system involved in multi-copper enzyme maturation permease subunit